MLVIVDHRLIVININKEHKYIISLKQTMPMIFMGIERIADTQSLTDVA
jgi:hypothetical protein